MDISSTTTASADSGSVSVFEGAGRPSFSLRPIPRRRWIVCASRPVSSSRRFAARPVGAQRATSSPIRPYRATIPRTVVVFPVPGPPVRIDTPARAARRTASFCMGA